MELAGLIVSAIVIAGVSFWSGLQVGRAHGQASARMHNARRRCEPAPPPAWSSWEKTRTRKVREITHPRSEDE